LQGVEEYRRVSGLQSITSTCLKAAKISAILIDDGIQMDKKNEIEWHKNFIPFAGRILRTERVAEQILEQVRYQYTFTFFYSFGFRCLIDLLFYIVLLTML